MKQILQNLGTGETILAEVPSPACRQGNVLIRTSTSLLSVGTERMLIDFGKAGWIEKARKQPDKVKQVIDKIKTDGLFTTLETVKAKLDQPIPLGYCNAGRVIASQIEGADRVAFEPGDRLVSNGAHAEIVCVPKNLCAKIPEGVSDEEAAFTVVGAIGLQGIRLLQPTLGESITVTGLGLIGLIAVQLLRASGCRVLGIDFDPAKCALAEQFGAEAVTLSKGEDPVQRAMAFSRGRGMDGVLITASTQSNEPVHQAALMCRKRGRIVLVGVTGLELSRADFYEKELSFQVSCSYGPGRYDDDYEQKGRDYPVGFVRWTEQRNFEAVLDLIANRQIDLRPLISHRFSFDNALQGYSLIAQGQGLGLLLQYGDSATAVPREAVQSTIELRPAPAVDHLRPTVGLVGAGNFTGLVLLPHLVKTGARLKTIVSAGGVTGTHFGRKFGFELSSTDVAAVFDDPEINTVMITTRHNSHAAFVLRALRARKHVYVEKPLCLTREELREIAHASNSAKSENSGPILMVGFNRRFAPQVARMKSLLDAVSEPKTLVMTVNAGAIPLNHWTQDPAVGGGRVIGEGCHYIDLLRFLVGVNIDSVFASQIDTKDAGGVADDKMTITISFTDGSLGTIHYFANGHKSFPKERLEVFCAGRVLKLDNFRKLQGYGWRGFNKMNLWRQDKGHSGEIAAFISAITNRTGSPIPFHEIVEVTEATFSAVECARAPRSNSPGRECNLGVVVEQGAAHTVDAAR
ncbi:MAG TPA: bi-domain-containing oxidoreductase [Pyrinomonadaceae bacterium]|nr:bi-domain-containing oxidoreductase [Pyrinomonadaceae bacterium]